MRCGTDGKHCNKFIFNTSKPYILLTGYRVLLLARKKKEDEGYQPTSGGYLQSFHILFSLDFIVLL